MYLNIWPGEFHLKKKEDKKNREFGDFVCFICIPIYEPSMYSCQIHLIRTFHSKEKIYQFSFSGNITFNLLVFFENGAWASSSRSEMTVSRLLKIYLSQIVEARYRLRGFQVHRI